MGIAISPSGIRVARMERHGKRLRLRAFAETAMPHRDHDAMREHADEYADVLAGLVKAAGGRAKTCVATLPFSRGLAATATLPTMSARELRRITTSPHLWSKHLGVAAETHDLAWRVLAHGGGRKQMSLLLNAAPREDVELYRELFRRARLHVRIPGLACLDFLYAAHRSDRPKCFLALDPDDIYLVHFGPGVFEAQTLQIDAREWQTLLAEDADEDALAEALGGLARELRRRLEEKPLHPDEIEAAFAVGADALQKRLELLQAMLPDTQLAPANICEDIAVDPKTGAPGGAMKRALALAQWPASPPAGFGRNAVAAAGFITRQPSNYRKAAIYGAASIVTALLLAAWHAELRDRSSALTARLEQHAALTAQSARHRQATSRMQSEISKWRQLQNAARALAARQAETPGILEALGAAVTADVQLDMIDCRWPQRCKLTGFTASYEQVMALVEKLGAAECVAGAVLQKVTPVKRDGRETKQFAIACHFVPETAQPTLLAGTDEEEGQ